MAVDPMEEVAKRMQGLKDSRSKIGELARGKNMYPGGNAAQSGPGGPDMGRPPNPVAAVPPQAAQAVQNLTQAQPTNPVIPQQMNPNLQQLQNKVAPQQPQAMAARSKQLGNLARQAMQAAAQRKLQRGR